MKKKKRVEKERRIEEPKQNKIEQKHLHGRNDMSDRSQRTQIPSDNREGCCWDSQLEYS